MGSGEVKDTLYEQFARIGKAVASPRRIELLDLLAQGERNVDALALASGMTVANTSAHLQALRRARLVETRKEGTTVHYRLAGDEVATFFVALRELAGSLLAEVEQVARDYFGALDHLEPVTHEELLALLENGEVVAIDVRPHEEYVAGHIPGALSVPLDQLDAAVARLPERAEVVAYCRGPYCVLAPQAVARLRDRGRRARRLEDGLPEWRLAGLPIAVGEEGS